MNRFDEFEPDRVPPIADSNGRRYLLKPMRVTDRCVAILIALGMQLGLSHSISAQQLWVPAPDRDARSGPNRISLDMGVLAAALGYSRQISPNSEWGIAVSGGAQTGFMLSSSELAGDDVIPLFAELLGGAAFLRGDIGSRTELEGGARIGWFYHPTEYETIFSGLYTALHYRWGAARIGPRVYWGRVAEESGRSEVGFAVVPLLLSFRWSW